ncbi:MAG TPA: TIGR04283 family arsenosugar biosynthesis glycosyltransferase [Thermoguttaceae bacterium]|nr:TIGR04283 family arsenosugar biosynthesis glycosyltransferase [Thermoguttaceae bacterium]
MNRNSQAERCLIVFTRYPEPGKTKTRLIPAVGAEQAATIHREMTRHTFDWAMELARENHTTVESHFEGGDRQCMQACFGRDLVYRPQHEGDLGRRMERAFCDAFDAGVGRVVIVGTDCPGLDAALVRTAFERLEHDHLVLGPAEDGGYYLIGLSRKEPTLFSQIDWGTDRVLRQTLDAAEASGLRSSLLKRLADIDRPEDLDLWRRERCRSRVFASDPRISVILPTYNEADGLADVLRSVQEADDRNIEMIVADGGSNDATRAIADACGTRVVCSPKGRSRQMNAGAAVATGRILLFLHADTRLPRGFAQDVRAALAEPGVAAGAFDLRIDGASGSLRLIERTARLRAKYLQMPYGDQAIFLRTEMFNSLEGFSDLPIMEDFELVRRLRRRGRIALVDAPVVTSARRWRKLGPWRVTWRNQGIVLGYLLGIAPKRLARWYYGSQ